MVFILLNEYHFALSVNIFFAFPKRCYSMGTWDKRLAILYVEDSFTFYTIMYDFIAYAGSAIYMMTNNPDCVPPVVIAAHPLRFNLDCVNCRNSNNTVCNHKHNCHNKTDKFL